MSDIKAVEPVHLSLRDHSHYTICGTSGVPSTGKLADADCDKCLRQAAVMIVLGTHPAGWSRC